MTFDIRNFLDRLTPKKGRKNAYHCPICDGALTIDPKTGAYSCWREECDTASIREAINPWSNVVGESNGHSRFVIPRRKPSPAKPTPAPLPDKVELATLPDRPNLPDRTRTGENYEIIYNYSPNQWVRRIERPDGTKDPKPYHKTATGKVICGKGEESWPAYRENTVLSNAVNKFALAVEGEKCVNYSEHFLQIATTTLQGGSWTDQEIKKILTKLKDNGVAGLIYWPDNDKPGYKKAERFRDAAATVGLPFIQINPTRLWSEVPEAGDVADWVKFHRFDQSLMLDLLQQEINLAAEEDKEKAEDAIITPQPEPTPQLIEEIPEIEPNQAAYQEYLAKEEEQEEIENHLGVENWKAKVLGVQNKLNTLTYPADYTCNPRTKYIEENLVDNMPHKGIVLIKSPKGSGKSVSIKRIKDKLCGGYWEEKNKTSQLSLINENKPEIERIYHEKTGVKFISITARIALGRGQAVEWEIIWIEDGDLSEKSEYAHDGEVVQTATFLETSEGIGLCWDSLSKLFDRDWSNTIVVIDEIELGLSHVATSSTCKDRRSKILATLETKINECLNNNGLVIGADADLTDISYDYLTAIAPGHKPFIVEKQYIRPDKDKWDISYYSGKKDQILTDIDNYLSDESCEPIAVATDNQTEAEALANYLIKKYPYLATPKNGLIRIDSKITQSDFGKNFVKFCNEKIKEYQPKILIYTPSLGVGCSIDIPYFKYVFGLFFGNLEPSQCRQMLARVRHPVPRIIWCADRGKISSSDDCTAFLPDEIKRQMFAYNDTTTQVIDIALHLAREQAETNNDADILPKLIDQLQRMMGKDGSWNNPHIDLFCKLKARRNFALSQLAVQLHQELIDEGHNLTDYACEEKTNTGDSIKEEKVEIKWNDSVKTHHANDISLDEAKQISRKPNPTDEEKYQATKAFIKDELPDIHLTPEFLFKAIYKDNRRWLNAVKLFWMTQNIDATKEADRKQWRYKLRQFCDGVPYLPDVKTYSAKVETIAKIKLFEVIPLDDFNSEYWDDNPRLKDWLKNEVMPHKKLIKTAFNITVNKKTQVIKFVNKLLTRLGLKLTKTEKRGETKYYALDESLVLDEDRLNVIKALDLKRQLQLNPPSELVEIKPLETNQEEFNQNVYVATTPQATEETQQAIVSVSDIAQSEFLDQVDTKIIDIYPLFDFGRDLIFSWAKRLNVALMLGSNVAQNVYMLLPQQILNDVWASLTGGVQRRYCELFSNQTVA